MEIENNWKNYVNNQYIPFLIVHIRERNILNHQFKKVYTQNNIIESGFGLENFPKYNFGDSEHKEDLNPLFNYPDFEDHL